jgi:hygromycin-B 7''-O-kinase
MAPGAKIFRADAVMKLRPDVQISVTTAQSIVDAAGCEGAVATISMLHGGEIAAVHDIGFADPHHRALVLKVYPDDLHWKMQKEVTVIGLVKDRLGVPAPKIRFAERFQAAARAELHRDDEARRFGPG